MGILAATACASSSPPQPVSGLTNPSPSASSAPSAATSPAAVASEPPVSSLPAFQCSDQSGSGSGGAITPVSAVRVGAQQGFDRFVLQFSSALPSYTVTRQANSKFVNSPRGDQVQLAGTGGVLVTVRPIDWTSYNGTKQLTPGYTYIKEARQVQNFEGVQQWGLGIQGTPCLRVFTLTSPMRLVVDVQAS
jgi:hypothetical protein